MAFGYGVQVVNELAAVRLEELLLALRRFNADREWAQFHGVKNLSMALASEVGELVALLRWKEPARAEREHLDADELARLEDEIGDVMLVLLNLSDRLGVDLVEAAARKLAKNALKYSIDVARASAEPRE